MLERVAGIEPASSAWKAEVIAIIRYPHTVLASGITRITRKASTGPSDDSNAPVNTKITVFRTSQNTNDSFSDIKNIFGVQF